MIHNLPDFSKIKVLVIGDPILDAYWFGSTSRISAEAPVAVVTRKNSSYAAGGAANVALNLIGLGCAVTLSGFIGDDANGEILEEICKARGVVVNFFKSKEHHTIEKVRVMSSNQQLLRIDREESYYDLDATQIYQNYIPQLANFDLVILSDYNKGSIVASDFINQVRELNIPLFIDPKGNDFSKYQGATTLTPNLGEFEAIVGKTHSDQEICAKGKELIKKLNLDYLLVTRSENGMSLISADADQAYHIPTKAIDVYDVTGAGDTVIATFAAGVAAGMNKEQAAELSNIAAGIKIAKLGTSPVTLLELDRYFKEQNHTSQIIPLKTLIELVKQAKAAGETIAFTNGCFDLLHVGHVTYLNKASEYADHLIVAVNSDQSVTKLKGPTRPINSLQQRMEVLASLRAVDWVVEFDQDTPLELITQLMPDFLIKGGDYKAEDLPGYAEVVAAGGQVLTLDLIAGSSTTQMVQKIKGQ